MVMERNNRETDGTGSGSDWVGQHKKGREHVPGDDPVAATDPNAEGASLATDGRGLGQVDERRREAEAETSDRNRTERRRRRRDRQRRPEDRPGQEPERSRRQGRPFCRRQRRQQGPELRRPGRHSSWRQQRRALPRGQGRTEPRLQQQQQATRQHRDARENQNAKRFQSTGFSARTGQQGQSEVIR